MLRGGEKTTNWEKKLRRITDKGLESDYIKNSQRSNKTNNPTKTLAKYVNRNFTGKKKLQNINKQKHAKPYKLFKVINTHFTAISLDSIQNSD